MGHCSRVVAFGVGSLQTPEVVIISLIFKLATASPIGGWVPETSRSFHYWQPAPRWRLLPRLANPGNPVMSPHIGKGNRHLSHWIDSRKREGISGEKLPGRRATTPCNASQAHAQSTHKNASNAEHMGIPAHVHMQKPLTTRKHWCSLLLTLLNCIYL